MKYLFFLLLAICMPTLQAQVITSQHKESARKLVSQMTLREKIDYIGGVDNFYIRAIPRLGIPRIQMADGPQGIRNEVASTLYPSGIMAAATWNRKLLFDMGKAIGQDARSRGVHVMLGPGVNMYRSPLCGRNFEYYGEDPCLTSEAAVAYINGMQSEKVISTIKHFVANNQEANRYQTSSDIDERTLHEIYLPPYYNAIKKANVGAVMAGYNLVNHVYMTENEKLAIDLLRDKWGFDGIYMSDWGATHSSVNTVNSGLDLEMPSGNYIKYESLIEAIQQGGIPIETIDAKVQHILQTLIAFGFLDKEQKDISIPANNPFSKKTALELAREGVVLLRNKDNLLPLEKGNILLCGPNANMVVQGAGSGSIYTIQEELVSVRQAMEQIGKRFRITNLDEDAGLTSDIGKKGEFYLEKNKAVKGFLGEYFANKECKGIPVVQRIDKYLDFNWGMGCPVNGLPEDGFSVRWSGYYCPAESGNVVFKICGDDGYRLYIDGQSIFSDWNNHGTTNKSASLQMEKGKMYKICIEYFDNLLGANVKFLCGRPDYEDWKKKIRKADAVIYCGGYSSSTEGEGADRTFELPAGQAEMLKLIGENNPNSIAVINSGGSFCMDNWIDKIGSVLLAFYPGQKGGTAIAEIISGKISPSGKLPFSFEEKYEDNPCFANYLDNVNPKGHKYFRVSYNEGIFMGYRGYDKKGKQPRYPFGYGLSYSSFQYSNLKVVQDGDGYSVSFDVKNTGNVDASEVSQVYVRDCEASVLRPMKELKGFEKVFLKQGEAKSVTIRLNKQDFAFWDLRSKQFVVEAGDFEIMVGTSSQHILLKSIVSI